MSCKSSSSNSALVLGVIAVVAAGAGAALWYSSSLSSEEKKVESAGPEVEPNDVVKEGEDTQEVSPEPFANVEEEEAREEE